MTTTTTTIIIIIIVSVCGNRATAAIVTWRIVCARPRPNRHAGIPVVVCAFISFFVFVATSATAKTVATTSFRTICHRTLRQTQTSPRITTPRRQPSDGIRYATVRTRAQIRCRRVIKLHSFRCGRLENITSRPAEGASDS